MPGNTGWGPVAGWWGARSWVDPWGLNPGCANCLGGGLGPLCTLSYLMYLLPSLLHAVLDAVKRQKPPFPTDDTTFRSAIGKMVTKVKSNIKAKSDVPTVDDTLQLDFVTSQSHNVSTSLLEQSLNGSPQLISPTQQTHVSMLRGIKNTTPKVKKPKPRIPKVPNVVNSL